MKQQQESQDWDKAFVTRLRAVMDEKKLDAPTLARKLDIAPSSVYNWLYGSVPHRRSIRDLARTLGVTEEWLCSGDGPKIPPSVVCETIAEEFNKVSPDYRRIALNLVGAFSDEVLREKLMDAMAKNEFDAARFLIEELKRRTENKS